MLLSGHTFLLKFFRSIRGCIMSGENEDGRLKVVRRQRGRHKEVIVFVHIGVGLCGENFSSPETRHLGRMSDRVFIRDGILSNAGRKDEKSGEGGLHTYEAIPVSEKQVGEVSRED